MLERFATFGRDVSNLGHNISNKVRNFVNKLDITNKTSPVTIPSAIPQSFPVISDLSIIQEPTFSKVQLGSNTSSIASLLASSGHDGAQSDNTSNDNHSNNSQVISQNVSDDSDNDNNHSGNALNNNNNNQTLNRNNNNTIAGYKPAHPISTPTNLPNNPLLPSEIFHEGIIRIPPTALVNTTLFLLTDKQLAQNVDFLYRILNNFKKLSLDNKSPVENAKIIIDIYLDFIEIPYRSGKSNLQKTTRDIEKPVKAESKYIFPLGFVNLARDLEKCGDNEDQIFQILPKELLMEIITQVPTYFENFLFNQLQEDITVNEKIYNSSAYFSMIKAKLPKIIKAKTDGKVAARNPNASTQLATLESQLNSTFDLIANTYHLPIPDLANVFNLYEKFKEIAKFKSANGRGGKPLDDDPKLRSLREEFDAILVLIPNITATAIEPFLIQLANYEKELNKANANQKPESPEDSYLNSLSVTALNTLLQTCEKCIIPKAKAPNHPNNPNPASNAGQNANNNNAAPSLIPTKSPFKEKGIPNLPNLRQYQHIHDLKNVELNLKRFARKLLIAENNVQVLYALSSFSDWEKQFCGDDLNSRLKNVIAGDFLVTVKKLRDKVFVHSVDKFSVAKNSASENIYPHLDLARRHLLDGIHYALSNLDYLTTPLVDKSHSPKPYIVSDSEQEYIKSIIQNTTNGNYDSLTPEEQIHLFDSAILNSKISILAVVELIETNTARYDINQIMGIMENDEDTLSNEELSLKMNLDSYLQALGEAIGTLQKHEAMPHLMKSRIYNKDFPILSKMSRDLRDYRNIRTHEGFMRDELLHRVLSDITTSNMGILHELDQLFEKGKLEYSKEGYFNSMKAKQPSFDEESQEYYENGASNSCYVM